MSTDKPTPDEIRQLLAAVRYPGFPRDLVSLGMVADVAVDGGEVRVSLRLPGGRTDVPPVLERAVAEALAPTGLPARLLVAPPAAEPPGAPRGGPTPDSPVSLPGIRAVLAVSSAKGGVGKSTVATNLACAFASLGLRAGLLDADVHGPSLPIMMGTDARPLAAGGNRFHPVERHGVRCISMGMFLDETSPVIWRGPMVAGLLRQFLADCEWGDLDVLVIDLPPGTGDAQLTLAQQVRLAGAVVVTTPQDVALRDVMRGVAMFRQVQVPILGVVENMAGFDCPSCGRHDDVFGRGGGEAVARAAGAPLLASLPIDPAVRRAGDEGVPISLGEGPLAEGYRRLAGTLAGELRLAGVQARVADA
jgi:ATP-binding protein involved in chromosome partitioning